MFGKLKEKLKKSLSVFSKKTEEEAEVIEEPEIEVKPKVEKKKTIIKKPEVIKKKETKPEIEKKETITETPKIVEEKEEPIIEEKKGFFSKVKTAITTKKISGDKFEDLFWDLEMILLENNVSIEVIEKIKEDLKEVLVDKPLPRNVEEKIKETLKKTLTEILSFEPLDLLKNIENHEGPYIIAFFGINGSGKTTSIAKLAHYLKKNNKTVVLAACDTFRAAAIDQLEEHANNLNLKMIKHDYGSDAAAVAYDSVQYAKKNKVDVVLIDTAGRLHSNVNLMNELKKIINVVNPNLKIFIGESITGNDCIEQARNFDELVELDGVILTKADVDEKGGASISISYTIKKPILFLGMGQNYDDFIPFNPETILEKLEL
jgi:fused signal recognition particle receptor